MSMITELELHNFKCFRHQPIQFGTLTVLAGLNGMGKSSVIQALLLLRQSFIDGRSRRLKLSGDLVDLGTGADVFFDLADEDDLGFVIEIDGNYRSEFVFQYNRSSNSLATRYGDQRRGTVAKRTILGENGVWMPFERTKYFRAGPLLQTAHFQYLSAERLGPRKMLPWSEEQISRRSVGSQGEHVLGYLARYGSDTLPADDPRKSPTDIKDTVEGQVTAWLQETRADRHSA